MVNTEIIQNEDAKIRLLTKLCELREKYLNELDDMSITDTKELKLEFQNLRSYQEIITKHFIQYVVGREEEDDTNK